MITSLKSLKDYDIECTDGEIGHIKDLYFNEVNSKIRYAVVDTRKWLPGKKVLISPFSIDTEYAEEDFELHLSATKDQIRHSPSPEEDAPISAQMEKAIHSYYGVQPYWLGATGANGALTASVPLFYHEIKPHNIARDAEPRPVESLHGELRSGIEVLSYKVYTSDDKKGYLEDMIVDTRLWTIPYFVIRTGGWISSNKVLCPRMLVDDISWEDQSVTVNLSEKELNEAPTFDGLEMYSRDFEQEVLGYYFGGRKFNVQPLDASTLFDRPDRSELRTERHDSMRRVF